MYKQDFHKIVHYLVHFKQQPGQIFSYLVSIQPSNPNRPNYVGKEVSFQANILLVDSKKSQDSTLTANFLPSLAKSWFHPDIEKEEISSKTSRFTGGISSQFVVTGFSVSALFKIKSMLKKMLPVL